MDNLGDPATHTRSVLRPHGVFGVIAPFNFPLALAAGPVGGALVAGNTCVFKPARAGAMSGVLLMEALRDAGVPDGVCNLVMGPGDTVGDELARSEAIDGIVFTGSYEVGMGLQRNFTKSYPRPCIIEMGGKNPAIVMRSADLDKAAEGIMRAAFGFGARSAPPTAASTSSAPVHDELVQKLVEQTEQLTIGDPLQRENWLGPVTDQRAVDRFRQAVAEARRGRHRLHRRRGPRPRATWPAASTSSPPWSATCRPTIGSSATSSSCPSRRSVPVDSLDEALELSNAVVYGLTAGIYSEDEAEVEQFLDGIQTGVLYVNRRAGATTGAWPGVQPFGGWKGSGSTGKAALGPYYVAQFLREQSHTIVD